MHSLATENSYSCFPLTLLNYFPLTLLLYSVIYLAVSSNIGTFLSINPSTNVFVFEGFIAFHKKKFTYSGGTFSSGLTRVINLPIRIPD